LISFFLSNIFLAVLFVLALSGYGNYFVKKFSDHNFSSIAFNYSLGLGFLIIFTQLLLILGYFEKKIIIIFFILGLLLFFRFNNFSLKNITLDKSVYLSIKFWVILLLMLTLITPLIFKSLTLPLAWDEVMYHLPHAKEWARGGYLSINHQYRYPWFPFNFDILYSIPLLFDNLVFPKIIHSLCGLIIPLLFFSVFKKKYINEIILMTLVWFYISRGMYEKAYVELALSLFISASVISLYLWKNYNKIFYYYCSGFFIGIAIGIKYQGLFFLIPYIFFVLYNFKNLKISVLIKLAILIAIPSIYWYARNFFITGNPFNPVWANFFGLYDWNQEDFDGQFYLLKQKRHFLFPILFLFPLLKLVQYKHKDVNMDMTILFCILSVIIWYILSGYGRYLYGLFPLMTFLTSILFCHVFLRYKLLFSSDSLKNIFFKLKLKNICKFTLYPFIFSLLIIFMFDNIMRLNRSLSKIGYNNEIKNEILNEKIYSYEAINYINNNDELKRTYQLGVEASIFYFDKYVMGEIFGFGRYSDYWNLTSYELKNKLSVYDIDSILIDLDHAPKVKAVRELKTKLDDDVDNFEMIFNKNNTFVYKLKEE
jgi:hypothetical protein